MSGRPWWMHLLVALTTVSLVALGVTVWFLVRPAVAPATFAPTATPVPTSAKDAVAMQVCADLLTTVRSDFAAMQALGDRASASGDQTIHLDGVVVRDRSDLAARSVGRSDQGATAVELLAGAARLEADCLTGHYVTTAQIDAALHN